MDIEELTKDELAAYALDTFGEKLNKRERLEDLQKKVAAMKPKTEIADEMPTIKVDFLKHPVNGRVYNATPLLLRRGDMLPCDENGKTV